MKKGIIIIFCIVGLISCTNSSMTWEKIYGGKEVDIATDIIEISPDNIITIGYSASFGDGDLDIWLLSLNKKGEINWEKTIGDKHSNSTWSITYNNGMIMFTTETKSDDKKNDVILYYLSEKGTIKKNNIFRLKGNETIQSIIPTNDGGCLIIGNNHKDGNSGARCLLIKANSKGEKEWTKTYEDFPFGSAQDAIQTKDNGFIVSAIVPKDSFANIDTLLFKIDVNGKIQWSKTIGGSGFDILSDIKRIKNNKFILTGYTISKGNGSSDVWLIKIDENGQILMDKTFGGFGPDQGKSIIVTENDDYIITGWTESKGSGSSDVWVLKISSTGELIWDKTYGYEKLEWSYSIRKTTDNGYIIAGITMSKGKGDRDYYLLKINSDGNIK